MLGEIALGIFVSLMALVTAGALVFAHRLSEGAMARSENRPDAVIVIFKALGSTGFVAGVIYAFMDLGRRVPAHHHLAAFLAVALIIGVPVALGLRRGWIVRREVATYAGWLGSEVLENRRVAARELLRRAWAARRVRPALVAASRESEDPVVRWLAQECLGLEREVEAPGRRGPV